MCLIIVCPKGSDKNSEKLFEYIRYTSTINKDGMGIAYKKHNSSKVFISKGFFEVESVISLITKLNLKEDDELVFHARTGNKGHINNENCHPFVVDDSEEYEKFITGYVDKPVLFHNGTISQYSIYNSKYSDTYLFATNFLSNEHIQNILYDNPEKFNNLFKNILELSRLCIIRPKRGEGIITTGYYYKENGYMFSKDNYKPVNYGGYSADLFNSRWYDEDEYATDSYPFKETAPIALPSTTKSSKTSKYFKEEDDFKIKQISEYSSYNSNYNFNKTIAEYINTYYSYSKRKYFDSLNNDDIIFNAGLFYYGTPNNTNPYGEYFNFQITPFNYHMFYFEDYLDINKNRDKYIMIHFAYDADILRGIPTCILAPESDLSNENNWRYIEINEIYHQFEIKLSYKYRQVLNDYIHLLTNCKPTKDKFTYISEILFNERINSLIRIPSLGTRTYRKEAIILLLYTIACELEDGIQEMSLELMYENIL